MKNVVKVRIYPSQPQQVALSKAFGCARGWWNCVMNLNNETYKVTGKGLSRLGYNDCLPQLKKEFPWLAECYSQVLQWVSLNLSQAFINFFEGRAKYPNFKSKHGKQSIQYPQHVKLLDGAIKLPKIGEVKARIHRIFDGKLKTVTVSTSKARKYYTSLLFDDGLAEPEIGSQAKAVDIDVGLTHFAITSDSSLKVLLKKVNLGGSTNLEYNTIKVFIHFLKRKRASEYNLILKGHLKIPSIISNGYIFRICKFHLFLSKKQQILFQP
jgi:putative transposase